MLLVDCAGYTMLNLNESAKSSNGVLKFRGKFQEANAVNKNRRMYPEAVLKTNVDRLEEAIKNRGLVGELDHPTDSIIHFENCSHLVTKLWWEDNVLMGEGEVLKTPSGVVLKHLIEAGVRVGISSRGVGNGATNEEGVLVIGESYKLITFDAVADPSTFAAFQQRVVGSESFIPTNSVMKSVNSAIRNEGSSIYKLNAKALVSFLGHLFEAKTNEIKERLHKNENK